MYIYFCDSFVLGPNWDGTLHQKGIMDCENFRLKALETLILSWELSTYENVQIFRGDRYKTNSQIICLTGDDFGYV